MRIVLQRVLNASVRVSGETVGKIDSGLLALVAVGHDDTLAEATWLANKTIDLRVFEDTEGKMNRSIEEIGGAVLVVSQFTLLGDCRKGRRPAFTDAGPPELAERLYESYAKRIERRGIEVERGIFAANMQVSLVNDGPVTLILERTISPIG